MDVPQYPVLSFNFNKLSLIHVSNHVFWYNPLHWDTVPKIRRYGSMLSISFHYHFCWQPQTYKFLDILGFLIFYLKSLLSSLWTLVHLHYKGPDFLFHIYISFLQETARIYNLVAVLFFSYTLKRTQKGFSVFPSNNSIGFIHPIVF